MAITTVLTEKLGLDVPILSAPMAIVGGGALAAAVSNAGGLGFIGGGYCDRDWVEAQIDAAGNTPVGIGFITWALEKNPGVLDLALERSPKAIFLSFGSIEAFASRVKAAKTLLVAQVQTVEQARAALGAGADVIVAQGTEAGGHSGVRSTLPLVPAVVDIAGDVPVVAAGGIADGRGLAAALMLGASGVLCGTAFYASAEALAHPNAKQKAVAATGDHTIRGPVFDIARNVDWPDDWSLRTLQNDFSRQWHHDAAGLKADMARQGARYAQASAEGDVDVAAVIVGEGIGLVHASEPAADIVARIAAQAETVLAGAPRFISP